MNRNKKTGNNMMVILFFFLIGIFILYTFLKEKKDDKLLENNIEHFAILIKINEGNPHAASGGDFKYKVKNKVYEFNQSGDYKFMQIGDTVLIEYAVEDNSVARVIDKYYMQKYKKMKKG